MNSSSNSHTEEDPGAIQSRDAHVNTDAVLIQQCVAGSEEAWDALIDRYRNLIFSVPVKYGFSRDDANEVFQDVCLTLLSRLSSVRDPRTLPAWLIKVTAHQCFHWRAKQRRRSRTELADQYVREIASPEIARSMLIELEQEQKLREVIADMPERCRQLFTLLFFTVPPTPYEGVARSLGVATGSIASFRMRCLEQLRKRLEEKGF